MGANPSTPRRDYPFIARLSNHQPYIAQTNRDTMSKPGLAFGLNLTEKPGASKPAPPKRRPMFGDDEDSDNDGANKDGRTEEIGEFDDFGGISTSKSTKSKSARSKNGPPTQPP